LGLGAGLVLTLLAVSVLVVQVGRAGFERLRAFSNAMGYGGGTLAKGPRISESIDFHDWGSTGSC
jgi:hypothetical protein